MTFGLLSILNIYATIKGDKTNISFSIQYFLIYYIFSVSLFAIFYQKDHILGRFEYYIAHGYNISTLINLRTFLIINIIVFILIFQIIISCILTKANILLLFSLKEMLVLIYFYIFNFFILNLCGFLQIKYNISKILVYVIMISTLLFYKVIPYLSIYKIHSVVIIVTLLTLNYLILKVFRKMNNEIIKQI